MKGNSLFILIVFILLLPLFYTSGQKAVSITPVNNIPSLDGNADDVISLMTSYNFFQLEPDNGNISPSETKIIVLQSTDTLYIAFACFQNSGVTAKIQMRDKFGQSDDGIFLILG
ncbi:MAG TPA: hypothetical protein DD745_00355, partial [Bacteroidales bacterium]|nr:hypothetical protein [Bacteroidales bacterium]